MFLRGKHKALLFVQSDILVMTQPGKKCLDLEQENRLKSPTLRQGSALLNLLFMLFNSGESVLAGCYRRDKNSLHLVNPLPKPTAHEILTQKEQHPALAARDLNMPFIYNLNLFICNLVTKSTQPQFQQSHFSFRNNIKSYIYWKTHISIQKHRTGSTQQLFPFSCFVGSYGNGAQRNVNPEQLSATSKQESG